MRNGLIEIGATKSWFKNDKLHRENGPAKISEDIERYFIEGQLHRIGGPAVIDYENILKQKIIYSVWYRHSKIHRLNAPARIFNENSYKAKEYWLFNSHIKTTY
jgi:hypothetical protein